ncbi:DDE-type integrase/transposase/recombinase [Azotobacter chroococcum]|uniref:DDE-type integrase/transposase/recombinase n=1 Tax=Azotobacter chroococcum TaxID=353 RepID=UPI001F60E9C2|nr:DDE-type integrase/transposase/recombinase [Azotobacter chroococcum]
MAVSASNTRWRSDGFEFRCEDGARLLVTFVLECCDREAIGWVASPHGYSGADIRDIMLKSVKKRLDQQLPATPLQWLSDNSSTYTATMKRSYITHIPKPDRATALRNLAIAFEHYNEQHPHSALKYCSPREFRRLAKAFT